jgi:hypothetical protein
LSKWYSFFVVFSAISADNSILTPDSECTREEMVKKKKEQEQGECNGVGEGGK